MNPVALRSNVAIAWANDVTSRSDPVYQAYQLPHVGFVVAPACAVEGHQQELGANGV
jgi:hypothetical protein